MYIGLDSFMNCKKKKKVGSEKNQWFDNFTFWSLYSGLIMWNETFRTNTIYMIFIEKK